MIGLFSLTFLSGCKVDNAIKDGSSAEIVETLVHAYQKQDDNTLQKCYGISAEELVKDEEISFEKKFFLSMEAKKIEINAVEELFVENDYMYMGVYFDFVEKGGNRVPYYEEILTKQVRNGQYQIVTKIDYPRVVIDQIEANSEKIQKSKIRMTYEEEEQKYAKDYPEYADGIHEKLTQLLKGMTVEMEVNLRFLGVIFLMAIVELWLLLIATYRLSKPKKKRKIKDRAFRRM